MRGVRAFPKPCRAPRPLEAGCEAGRVGPFEGVVVGTVVESEAVAPPLPDRNFPLVTKVFARAAEPPLVVLCASVQSGPAPCPPALAQAGVVAGAERVESPLTVEIHSYSRKDKSLAVLCNHFVELYSTRGEEVCLRRATMNLSQAIGAEVERRRIYDIVNVLESVYVLERLGKNKYIWLGVDNIPQGLERLQREEQWPAGSSSRPAVDMRRENSLGHLSRAFVLLFLKRPHDVLSLDDAALQLLAKVRRLYDIANVLTSVGLIHKVKTPNSRKPAFRWAGPEPVGAPCASFAPPSRTLLPVPSSSPAAVSCKRGPARAPLQPKSQPQAQLPPSKRPRIDSGPGPARMLPFPAPACPVALSSVPAPRCPLPASIAAPPAVSAPPAAAHVQPRTLPR